MNGVDCPNTYFSQFASRMTLEPRTNAAGEITLGNEKMVSLIRRIAGGDSSALLIFYDGTSPLVFGLIMGILGDRTAAEETLLNVYTQVWKQAVSPDPGISPLEWLTALARNSAVARLHWSKRDQRKRETSRSGADSIPTVAPEQQDLARVSLASMAPTERELLEWAYYSGLSCAEMAAQIGKPLGAVKTHIRIGLSKLRESFSPPSGHGTATGTATGGHVEA
jgi:RNA polymerase sigma-70 factor, ECF subfamily